MADVAQILGVGETKRAYASVASGKTSSGELAPPPSAPTTHQQPSRALQKLQGKSREVMGLLKSSQADKKSSSAPLPPSVPAFPPHKERLVAKPNEEGAVKIGNRWIKIQTPARKWTWAPFSSSSRTDGTLFHHWVRSSVEYPDYPYARFDIHLDPICYSEEEYQRYLVSDTWTKSETDRLVELARRHEMRWPVIFDRWIELFYFDNHSGEGNSPPKMERKIEDLQFRFYQVAAVLNQVAIKLEASSEAQVLASATPDASSEDPKAATEHLLYETAAARQLAAMEGPQQPLIACPGSGTSNKVFDLEYERQRRLYMEALWNRTKEEEGEEKELRKELKQIEAQLRKIKKSGAHILAARKAGATAPAPAASGGGSASSSLINSRSASPVPEALGTGMSSNAAASATSFPAMLDDAFASTAPVATPGTPYLQSGRLVPPAIGGSSGLNKSLLSRMDAFLKELKVPERPLPSKRVCDMYDSVRKDVIALLLVLKNVLQKEGLLQSKRLRLERLTGDVRITEESVMGMSPSPQAPPLGLSGAASGTNVNNTNSSGRPKSKGTSKGSGKIAQSSGTSVSSTAGPTKSKGAGATKVKAGGVLEEKVDPNSKSASAIVPAAGGPAVAVVSGSGKQGVGRPGGVGKQVAGGKQAKKPATKRKRKAETSKSPVPGQVPVSAAFTDKKGEAATTAVTAAQQQPTEPSEARSTSGKKRPRKAGTT